MGLFNKLGREVEKFTQNAKAAAEGEGEHECAACGARYRSDRDRCGECGSSDVVPVGDESTGGQPTDDESRDSQPTDDEPKPSND